MDWHTCAEWKLLGSSPQGCSGQSKASFVRSVSEGLESRLLWPEARPNRIYEWPRLLMKDRRTEQSETASKRQVDVPHSGSLQSVSLIYMVMFSYSFFHYIFTVHSLCGDMLCVLQIVYYTVLLHFSDSSSVYTVMMVDEWKYVACTFVYVLLDNTQRLY